MQMEPRGVQIIVADRVWSFRSFLGLIRTDLENAMPNSIMMEHRQARGSTIGGHANLVSVNLN